MDIEKAVKLIEGKLGEHDKKTQEAVQSVKEAFEQEKKAFDTERKAFEGQVADLNKKLGEKEATFEQISGEVKELKAKAGRPSGGQQQPTTVKQLIHDAIGEHRERFLKVEKSGNIDPIEIKTVAGITSANLTVANFISYLDWRPGMEPLGQTRFRDLCRTIQSETDFVQFPRANTPIGEGSFGRQATESTAKAQVDRDYTMVSITLKPMAGFAIVSRQSLRNIIFLQSWLPTSMLEQMLDTEDLDFGNALVAGATASSTTPGVTVAAERLIEFVRILIQAKYNPNAIAVDPAIWSVVLRTKPQDYSTPGVVSIDPGGNTRILGRPIVPVNWLTGGRILMGDWSKVAIVQSEGLTLRQTDSHASTFVSNDTTFLIERTEALAIFRPDAFLTTTLS